MVAEKLDGNFAIQVQINRLWKATLRNAWFAAHSWFAKSVLLWAYEHV